MAGVGHVFLVTGAAASGESAGPLQARNGEPGLAQQLSASTFAAVGQLLPPDADRTNAGTA